jgi:hypothetical protein
MGNKCRCKEHVEAIRREASALLGRNFRVPGIPLARRAKAAELLKRLRLGLCIEEELDG